MLKSASFENFKSIGKTSLDLAPLTILTGYNSSGKSNILEALSFFGQANRLLRGNESTAIDFTNVFHSGDIQYPQNLVEYIAHNKEGSKFTEIRIDYDLSVVESFQLSNIVTSLKQDFQIMDKLLDRQNVVNIETIGYSYSFNFERQFKQKIFLNNVLIAELASSRQNQVVFPRDNLQTSFEPRYILQRDIFSKIGGHSQGVDYFDSLVAYAYSIIREKAGNTYYISSERGAISPEKKTTNVKEGIPITWVGHRTENILELLSDCAFYNLKAFNRIAYWADRFNLGDLRAGLNRDYILSSRFRDEKTDAEFNTFLSGLGARQILSIITQIFYSQEGDTILIEEPEITLHPKYQVLLHELFAEAIKDKKQIICTTHSPFFVLAVSKIVRNKRASLEDIIVYDIKKTSLGTEANKLPLNKDGFVEGGIESFSTVEAELYQEWMDSVSLDEE